MRFVLTSVWYSNTVVRLVLQLLKHISATVVWLETECTL